MIRLSWAALLVAGLGQAAFAQVPPSTPAPPREEAPPVADPAAVDPAPPAEDVAPAPAEDPRNLPIERQPRPVAPQPPADPNAVEPLPGEPLPGEPLPPPPEPRDPAYGRPVPEGANAGVPIQEIVRNPVRVYEARLLMLMGHAPAAAQAIDTLGRRFPTDARVAYLRFFLLSRSGQPEPALESLRQAVSLETLYPIGDYNRFMEPIQGPDRIYAERVRRAAAELASLDRLVEPAEAELLPPAGPITIPGAPMPAVPGRPGVAPAPADSDAEPAPPVDETPDTAPDTAPEPEVAPEPEL